MLPPPKPQPIQPHIMREDEADELHAAQHLLNQGMISPKQFSGLLEPSGQECEPARQPDINAQNAVDYQQRQEQLAQQLGTVPESAVQTEEQLYGQQSDF